MPDPIEQVLRLVSDGRLTAAEAAQILDALAASNAATEDAAPGPGERVDPARPGASGDGVPGRSVVDPDRGQGTRPPGREPPDPGVLGRFAVDRIPGLSESAADLVRQALAAGRTETSSSSTRTTGTASGSPSNDLDAPR